MNQGGGGNQTVTQQNIPGWAMDYAQNTLDMTKYYTNNQNYRPSTLDRDYSGIRGYNADGQPNSQVGQFGLNPNSAQPGRPNANDGRPIPPSGPPNLDDFVARNQLPPDLQTGGPLLRAPVQNMGPDSFQRLDDLAAQQARQREGNAYRERPGGRTKTLPSASGSIMQNMGPDSFRPGTGLMVNPNSPGFVDDRKNRTSRGGGRTTTYAAPTTGPMATPGGDVNNTAPGGSSSGSPGPTTGPGAVPGGDTNSTAPGGASSGSSSSSSSSSSNSSSNSSSGNTNNQTTLPAGLSQEDVQGLIDSSLEQFDENTITPDEMPTPFQAYDRQRFAAPSQNTVRGEDLLAGRYDQRFGPGGTDPFAAANAAVGSAANYQSGFQGTTGGIGGQAGNYQAGLGSATNPNVFQSGNYTSGLPNFANPNADMRNVNAGMGNVNAGVQNVNAGLRSQQFGNANQSLQGPVNYQQQRSLRDSMQQFQDPYTDRVVNQTIKDMDRARQMTSNQISGDAAKAGAFGGSRSMLMQAENNRNFADRTAAAVGQLRSQGFQRAADLAQQENLQRLGLSASDVQNVRGLTSQGNLQGQNLTARDLQDVRGLQSQGALTAQGLRSQGGLAAQGLRSQGGLAAQGLQSQGALAALGANAGLYQSALGLNAAGDRSAMGYNAGLLSDAMGLDASDLNQRRNIASNEAQFSETAKRGAGALNLQGGQALGQLAQAGTADERQRIADLLASGQAGDARNQQDLDFIYGEFDRELAYPGRQIDLRNAAISPATGSIVTTTQPRYQQNPLLAGLGAGVGTYALAGNPYLAGAAGLLSYLNS